MPLRAVAAVILALAAAFCFALSNVLEQREAEQLPDDEALRPALVGELAHRPWWLAGFGIDISGYGFHAAALGFASLVFVQPLLVTGLLFALALRAAITGIPIRRRDLLAGVVLAAGLALFLLGVSPHGGQVSAPISSWIIAGPVIVGAIAVCVGVGSRLSGPPRALFLGIGAGISFGVSVVFTKTFVHLLGGGIPFMLSHWEPYALAASALGGLLLAQQLLPGRLPGRVGRCAGGRGAGGRDCDWDRAAERAGQHARARCPAWPCPVGGRDVRRCGRPLPLRGVLDHGGAVSSADLRQRPPRATRRTVSL